MKPKHQRLMLALLAVGAVAGAAALALSALQGPGGVLLCAGRCGRKAGADRQGGAARRHGRGGSIVRKPDGISIRSW
jgi:cytochrome c-type biogenesis protein CcmE